MSGLRLDNNGSSHSLQASWQPAVGGVEQYLVTLSAPGSAPQEHHLPPNSTQVVFEDLTPGQSYQLSVRTAAGGLSSETRTSGRTGTCSGLRILLPCRVLLLTHRSSNFLFQSLSGCQLSSCCLSVTAGR